MTEPIKLNLGAGHSQIEGFTPIDRRNGTEAYPLAYPDNSVDEIRASHLLEHFSHRETVNVLRDWVRALKPGGILRIAVPDFDALGKMYADGSADIEAFLMGGHTDNNDVHLAIFNRDKLTELMTLAGLVKIEDWKDEKPNDCSAYPFSLNLMGVKAVAGEENPAAKNLNDTLNRIQALPEEKRAPFGKININQSLVGAVMSVPRLGFMDMFFCVFQALLPQHIQLKKVTGAYWGQCLQRGMQILLKEANYDYIITLDYDSVFQPDAVTDLIKLMQLHPEADAIAPIECHRSATTPLMTLRGEDGKPMSPIPYAWFADQDLLKIHSAHFGLTIFRTSTLKTFPKPWFLGVPDENGDWGDGRVDDDIYFWNQWAKSGNSLYLANRITIGHAELMVRWPDMRLQPIFQAPNEFWEKGKPEGVWK